MSDEREFLRRRVGVLLAVILCSVPGTVWAAATGEKDGVLPPMLRDVIVILSVVLSVILLIAVAILWTMQQSTRERLSGYSRMEGDMKAVTAELRELQSVLMPDRSRAEEQENDEDPVLSFPDSPVKQPPPVKRSVWQSFADDFNSLARSMDIPKADIACENFVELHKLVLLTCLSHGGFDGNGNEMEPAFSREHSIDASTYWAWPIPEEKGRYAVVPNPVISYNDKLHREGGMKETFASNFENSGVAEFHHVEVKLPAIFSSSSGKWKIEQPGLIRLTE